MKSISKIYFAISFIVVLLLVVSILFFNKESHKDKLQELRRYAISDFEKVLAYENANLLSFALALSEDGALKEALYEEKQQEGYELLYSISERFKKNTHIKKLRLQLLNNEFEIFAQNWKQDSVGMPLSWFRSDLKKLKLNKKPKVGIETGRRLTFKATIPIQYGQKYIGYLEVIKFIDDFAEKLHQQSIELFALMDPKYIKLEDSLMKNFPRLKDYVIANENYNSKLKAKAENFKWDELKSLGYYKYDEMLFLLKPMYNGEYTQIGEYLIVLPKHKFEEYRKSYQDVSFITRFSDEDIYNFVKRWEHPNGSYRNVQDRELLELLPKLYKKDKVLLTEAAKGILNEYSKEELIDIILKNNHKVNKIGKIE
jgi:hypothetical protein